MKKALKVSALSLAIINTLTISTLANAAQQNEIEKDDIETISVTGIRSSLSRSQMIKRYSASVVEAISADDLGKFADENIVDGLSRVPGVQVERNDGGQQGDRISVRGLGPQFVTATVNGRTLLSAGREGGQGSVRSVNLNVLPPNMFSGVIVKKTPTASDTASGLGGSVDLQLLKPSDLFKNKDEGNVVGSVSVRTDYPTLSEELGYRVNGIIGFKSDDEVWSGYVTALQGESHPSRNQNFPINTTSLADVNLDDNADGIADRTATVTTFSAVNLEPIREDRLTNSISGALQFSPSSDLRIVADYISTEFDNKSFRNRGRLNLLDNASGAAFQSGHVINSDFININEQGNLTAVDFDGCTGCEPIGQLMPILFNNKTNTTLSGINFDWQINNNLNMVTDLYFSHTEYEQDLQYSSLLVDLNGGNGVSFETTNESLLIDFGQNLINSNNATFTNGATRRDFFDAKDYGVKFDFSYELEGNITSIDFGLRYSIGDVDAQRTAVGLVANSIGFDQGDGISYPAAPGEAESALNATFGEGVTNFGDIFPALPNLSIDEAKAVLPALSLVPAVDPTSSYQLKEKILALYTQANFDIDYNWSGNVGLRAVQVKTTAKGAEVSGSLVAGNLPPDSSTLITPVEIKNDYIHLLPSANLSYKFTDDVVFRLAGSKTLTMADPSELAPRANISVNEQGQSLSVSKGNPNLDPLSSVNFDATIEFYTQNDGAIVFSIFRKMVSNFIIPRVSYEQYGNSAGLIPVSQFENYSDGNLAGFEIGGNQPLDFVLDGLGIQANYTYVDSSFDKDVGDEGFGFPGSSKDNFNAILYYEKSGFGARLTYSYRDDYLNCLAGNCDQNVSGSPLFTQAQSIVNLNFGYDLTENVNVTFEVNNITSEDRRDFAIDESNFAGYYEKERTVVLGLSTKF
ncbi:TonB-dependent receptor [Pseudoalteromonas sp. ZZD1]|uniref:TonB-dependent receptor n=1 Tax=Pseudoalteromonas sp. ZZD1 TaxID=3139395 RepID=UPI003BABA3DB